MKYLSLLVAALLALPAAANSRTGWFEDARFGMFIHFGLYSIPAGIWDGKRMTRNDYAEWIRMQHDWPKPGGIPKADYDGLLGKFNPQGFDAEAWVREVENAGMRYLVITAKHHDGFALWDSKVSDYNVVKATPFKRDILAELTAACRKHGLKVGFYYSHWLDWEYPGGGLPPWPEQAGDPPITQPTQEAYEAIHGTRPAPYPQPEWGRLTVKTVDGKQRLNAFVYDPKPGAKLKLVGPAKPPVTACVLETRKPLAIGFLEGGFEFTLPKDLPDDKIVTLVFDFPLP